MTRKAPTPDRLFRFLLTAASAAVFVCACAPGPQEPRAPAVPKYVVTLAPNLTEIVFAVGAGKKVIATDDFSDMPPEARQLPKVGGVQPNPERIAALRPDLVLASPTANQPQLAASLRAVGVPLENVRVDHIADIAPAMRKIGARLGGTRTEAAVAEFERALEAQRRTRTKKPRVLFIVLAAPMYVAGRKSFADELFAITGAENAVEVEGWPQYSLEPLAVNAPDVLLFSAPSVKHDEIEALLASAPMLRGRTKVVAVDEALFSRAGPRIPEAAARLNAILDELR